MIEGQNNFIPNGAWIRIEFQRADALFPGSNEVDIGSILPTNGTWSPNPAIGKGAQFLRFRVTFNVADSEAGYRITPETRIPVLEFLRLPVEF